MTDQLELADLAQLPTQDPDFFASEYNNRARVPSHPVNLARWAEWSRQVRERAGARLYLPYAEAGSLRPQDASH